MQEAKEQTRIKRHLNFYCYFAFCFTHPRHISRSLSCCSPDVARTPPNKNIHQNIHNRSNSTNQSLFYCKYLENSLSKSAAQHSQLSIKLCDWKTWFLKTVHILPLIGFVVFFFFMISLSVSCCRIFIILYAKCWRHWTVTEKKRKEKSEETNWNRNRKQRRKHSNKNKNKFPRVVERGRASDGQKMLLEFYFATFTHTELSNQIQFNWLKIPKRWHLAGLFLALCTLALSRDARYCDDEMSTENALKSEILLNDFNENGNQFSKLIEFAGNFGR